MNPAAYKNCNFTKYDNTAATNAKPYTSATTEEACLDYCIQTAGCKAIEYSTGLGCYYHDNDEFKATKTSSENVALYQLDSCCEYSCVE